MTSEYKNWGHVDAQLDRLKGLDHISDGDFELIEGFTDYKKGYCSAQTIDSNLKYLAQVRRKIEVPLEEIEKEDVMEFSKDLNTDEIRRDDGGRYSEPSKTAHKSALRQFLKFRDEYVREKDRSLARFIKLGSDKNGADFGWHDIPKIEDVYRIIQDMRNVRDKAAIEVMFAGAVRPLALPSINWEHIDFDSDGDTTIHIPKTKTGQRYSPVYKHFDFHYLWKWKEEHPKVERGEPVFSKLKGGYGRFSYESIVHNMGKYAEGYRCKTSPKWIRKAAALHMAVDQEKPAFTIAEVGGWKDLSTIMDNYLRFRDRKDKRPGWAGEVRNFTEVAGKVEERKEVEILDSSRPVPEAGMA